MRGKKEGESTERRFDQNTESLGCPVQGQYLKAPGAISPLENVWQSLDTFLVITAHREAAKHRMYGPYTGRLQTTKRYATHNVTSAKAEKLCSRQTELLYCPVQRLCCGGQEAR